MTRSDIRLRIGTRGSPLALWQARETRARLIAARLKKLPDMQRRVLDLYYFKDLRLREIAQVYGLTESRICQIHAKAIQAIKAYLKQFGPHSANPL